LKELEQMSPQRTQIEKEDIFGAIASFWLVFIATIPAVIPFFFIADFHRALRVSNGLLVALLFVAGFTWAKYANSNRWAAGLFMMGLGLALVIIAIALARLYPIQAA
jgi:VIT1/CCC1 family predicted Fe2+/Mn2+ transporter